MLAINSFYKSKIEFQSFYILTFNRNGGYWTGTRTNSVTCDVSQVVYVSLYVASCVNNRLIGDNCLVACYLSI